MTRSSAVAEGAREQLLAGLPVKERRLELAGISTAVLEGGDGPPVILLHGPGEYAAKWMRVIPDLVTTHRVVAPDLPGHGTSEVTDGPLDVDRVFAWLDELIERTCTSPPALVGHLLGGAIAARFASGHRHPALRTLMGKLGVPQIPSADLARISVPTTLIWGRHNLGIRLRVGEAASAHYGWPLHVIENAADDPPIEQPEAFLRALHATLDTTTTRRP